MRLHWGWAVPGALLFAAGLVWWFQPGHGDAASDAGARLAGSVRHATGGTASGPTLYRWVDRHGVVNISTDKPRAGVRFSIVRIDPGRNIVPIRAPGRER